MIFRQFLVPTMVSTTADDGQQQNAYRYLNGI